MRNLKDDMIPSVVYHGSYDLFYDFREESSYGNNTGMKIKAIFFTDSIAFAKDRAGNTEYLYECTIRPSRVKSFDCEGHPFNQLEIEDEPDHIVYIADKYRDQYDCLIFKNIKEANGEILIDYVMLNKNNIEIHKIIHLSDNKILKGDSLDMKRRFRDTSADEIIDLINQAADEGRTWNWLEKRLPEGFLYTGKGNWRSRGKVFPTSNDRNDVNLIKPPADRSRRWEWQGPAIDLEYRNRVKHLTKNQENYIRSVIANSGRDIDEWKEVYKERQANKPNYTGLYPNDPIVKSKDFRYKLQSKLGELKALLGNKLNFDTQYDIQKIVKKANSYDLTTTDLKDIIEKLTDVLNKLPDYDAKIADKKQEIENMMNDYRMSLNNKDKPRIPDSLDKKNRRRTRDTFISPDVDHRVNNWRDVLHIYLEWEGIIGYDYIIESYLDEDDYDGLREFLNDEGIYGYYYKIIDIFETGEVNIPDIDEEDYERFF